MSTTSKKEAISAALAVAEDLDSGKIDTTALDRQLETEITALVENVVGPGDEPAWLWDLQVRICRGVLAVGGGLNANELSEWCAVARSREMPSDVTVTTPEETVSSVSGA